jgi:tRNA A37 threonylcarbamoyladenosine dehydratase
LFYLRNPQERDALAGKHITIVGCGSFGSALADMLVRAGLGALTLIDPETLSVENIGRHLLTSRDLGKAKVHALAERLREVNPELEVDARQEKFRDAGGLLICCADSRRCESIVALPIWQRAWQRLFAGWFLRS